MPALTTDMKAERAHAQSIVISANLEQLVDRVADIDPGLCDDLRSYAGRFDDYVRRLDREREREDAQPRRCAADRPLSSAG